MDEDAELRTHLADLGPGALADLRRVLEGSADYRREILVALMGRPRYSELATMIAMADTDEVIRLRLLQAIRDVTSVKSPGPPRIVREREAIRRPSEPA